MGRGETVDGEAAALVQLRGVVKVYREAGRERVVLRGVDAEVRRGEIVALIGPSGCGKSTLLNLIGGIDRPTEGAVVVDGARLSGMAERERTLFRRRSIGFVFQFFNLIPTLTVQENLLLPLELRGDDGAAARRRARTLLEDVGLGDRTDGYPDRLSGGEQQRVAVARALVHEPALVLADEPTGNLGAETGERVLDLLERLARRAGRTVIVVSHSAEAAERADRVYALREGRLRERERSVAP